MQAKKNGWVKVKGGYKYYKNGKAYTGWHKMGKAEGEKKTHWSYFGKNGVMYTGWKKMGKAEGEKTAHWCYFGSNGWLRTGWVQLGKGTANPDGNVTKHWSYFGSNGWLRTGWVQFGKGTANPDGNVKKHWSYFGSNGWLRTGWVQFGKGTSEPDGNVKKHWSYFGSNGWLKTGWVQFGKGTSEPDGNVAKHWSFFGDNGWLRTELQSIWKGTSNPDGNSAKHLSYFGSNGWLRVNQIVTVKGKKYRADGKGWLSDYENDVFMKYLKKIYNGATYYKYGLPHHAREKGYDDGTDSEGILQYVKYAIADFDGDGKNELIIYLRDNNCYSNRNNMTLESFYGLLKYYEADSSGKVIENEYFGGVMHGKFAELKIECLNNGVIKIKEKSNNSHDDYIPFNKSVRTSLKANQKMRKNYGKDYSTYNYFYEYGQFYDAGSGRTSYGYYCGASSLQDYMGDYSMTKSEYDKEIKLLTSGKKINVTWKDFTSANIK